MFCNNGHLNIKYKYRKLNLFDHHAILNMIKDCVTSFFGVKKG